MACSTGTASEPAGAVVIDWALRSVDGVTPTSVDVTLASTVRLSAAAIRFETPLGVEFRAAGGGPDADFARSGKVVMGGLRARAPWVTSFDVSSSPGAGGLAILVVEGIGPDGRVVLERTSIPLGVPAFAPRIRHGAAEFPAASSAPRGP